MKDLLLVFLGGGAGSCCRFLCSALIRRWAEAHGPLHGPALLPWGTLGVNLAGSLVIGLCYGLFRRGRIDPDLLMLLTAGFCGGFTTFSTFSSEMLTLLRAGQTGLFLLYAAASLLLGLAAVWAGHRLGLLF